MKQLICYSREINDIQTAKQVSRFIFTLHSTGLSPPYQTTSHISHNYHSAKSDQNNSQFKTVIIKIKKQKIIKVSPPCRMIIANHGLSQCSGCCHFDRFDHNIKAYAADTDTEDSDCLNEKKQIYHTVKNNNNSEEPESEEDNSAINFVLSKSSQCVYECQQCHEKYFI